MELPAFKYKSVIILEHDIIEASKNKSRGEEPVYGDYISEMTAYGNQGWELVSVSLLSEKYKNKKKFLYIFKKPFESVWPKAL